MNFKEILELTRAGFTRDEILAMDSAEQHIEEQPTGVTAPEENQTPNPSDADSTNSAPSTINLTDEQLKQLIQGVAVQTTSGKVELPKDINSTLADRLASIMKGE